MKTLFSTFLLIATLFISSLAFAQDVHVNGYYRSNGTYVKPHMRSAPDGNPYNNWSTQGNVNPYTGSVGTRRVAPSPNFGSGGIGNNQFGSGGLGSNNSRSTYGNSLGGNNNTYLGR